MATYLNIDVLDVTEPDRGDAADEDVERRIVLLDSATGTRTSEAADSAPSASRVFRWRCFSRADWRVLKTFIDGKFGRAVPFWLITWEDDLDLTVDIAPNDLTITVEQCSYTALLFQYPSRRHIAFLDKLTGTRYFRKITAAVDGGSTETLTLDSSLGVSLPMASTAVSFLRLSRLDSDTPRIEWEGGQYATCDLPIKEIPWDVT